MKNTKLIVSKRILNKVMRDFLIEVDKSVGGTGKHIYLRQGPCFAAVMYEEQDMTREFTYCIEDILERGGDYRNGIGVIAANMGHRAAYAKGFAQVTRILLHEFGHHMTYHQIMALYGEDTMAMMYAVAAHDNHKYLSVPCEFVATKWALDWLADSEHRKIAREFEHKFWACFE